MDFETKPTPMIFPGLQTTPGGSDQAFAGRLVPESTIFLQSTSELAEPVCEQRIEDEPGKAAGWTGKRPHRRTDGFSQKRGRTRDQGSRIPDHWLQAQPI